MSEKTEILALKAEEKSTSENFKSELGISTLPISL
jgi:hypothetical protein